MNPFFLNVFFLRAIIFFKCLDFVLFSNAVAKLLLFSLSNVNKL